MSESRKSLDDRIIDASGGRERVVTLTELTGKSEQEIAQMTDEQLSNLTDKALENLQDMAEKNQEITKLYLTGADGKTHEIKVVPAALDTPEANAVKDGRAGSNIYNNGKQTNFMSMRNMLKRDLFRTALHAPGKQIQSFKQKASQQIEKGASEFGR